ncbi:MAG: DUF3617 family protein [Proteobacteria bacterium]|nr:DUF3617 family protein [Pseudomonadota bacterium]
MTSRNLAIAACATILLTGPTGALAMKIKPGNWEFRSTNSMHGANAAQEQVGEQCINDPVLKPDTLMKEMNNGCRLTDSQDGTDAMSWKVSCSNEGGEMTGNGNVRREGDGIVGGMEMTMSFKGQTMNMNVGWTGKYLGPCS